MKRISYPSGNPIKLVDELAAVPSLAPIVLENGWKEARFQIGSDDRGGVWLIVPDDADDAAIAAVLAAHDPTPAPVPALPDFGDEIPPDILFQLAPRVQQARAFLANPSPNNAAVVLALKLTIRLVLWLVARQIGR